MLPLLLIAALGWLADAVDLAPARPSRARRAPGVGAACGADALEPNGRRRLGRRLGVRPLEGVVCRGDEDWFRLRLSAGAGVEVSLRHAPDVTLPPPQVFPPGRRRPIGAPYVIGGEAGTRFTAPVGGVYGVRVHAARTAPTRYRLRFWTDDP